MKDANFTVRKNNWKEDLPQRCSPYKLNSKRKVNFLYLLMHMEM